MTIATNMAGRGTDIQLGGNLEMRLKAELAGSRTRPQRETRAAADPRARSSGARRWCVEAGGLFVVGSERHESRRIDNQLRGRSGRQGDPGASKFFVSLEDDLMRIFGSERMDSMLQRLGLKEGEAIIHPWVNKALAKAQQKVEARNYDIRKQLLKYDDVMNDQRKVVYEQRREIMNARDVAATIADMRDETIDDDRRAARSPTIRCPSNGTSQALHAECLRLLGLDLPVAEWAKEEGIAGDEVEERIVAAADRKMAEKTANYGPDADADGREEPAAAAARPDLEGPPPVARPSAPGHQSARLCAARPAQRIQARGVRAVRGDAGQSARAGHLGAEPCRIARSQPPQPAYGDGAAASPRRRWPRSAPAGTAGRPPAAAPRRSGRAAVRQRRRPRRPAPRRPARALGRHRPQRPMPLRLRQEIQALPRPRLRQRL